MWLVLNHECTKEIICKDDIEIRVPHMKLLRQLHMGAAVSHSRASYLVVREDGRRRARIMDVGVGEATRTRRWGARDASAAAVQGTGASGWRSVGRR